MNTRFCDQSVCFENGIVGENIAIDSASPRNYYQAISQPEAMPAIRLDGKLFVPRWASASPSGHAACVIIVPGSLGIAASHLVHAETLTNLGLAVFVLDPFGPRSVSSTVSNQTLYSFAASAYDVLATVRVLARDARLDPARIGAQGHSRGGSAVMMAATRRMAVPVLGDLTQLSAVLAAYPWSGHQFLDPRVGDTKIRVLMGDRDEWCLPQQVQGHVQSIRLVGGDASMRLFKGAAHSFDRGTPVCRIADAAVSPGAPTGFIADDGAFIHPLENHPDPTLVDRDLMVYALKAGYGVKGASIGSAGEDAAEFRTEMVKFWRDVFL